jgi:hypothetical protein
MVRFMGDEPPGHPPRSKWRIAAALAVLIAVTGGVGAVVATLERPTSSPPRPTPTGTPFPFPSFPLTPVPSGPVLGFGFSAVDDPATHQLLVFGGVDSYDTTWLWNGARWSLARPLVSPAGRFGAAAAYDPATRQVMLFGGRLAPGEVENDTWAWNGTIWNEMDTGIDGPPVSEGASMAWDNATGQMVLVTPAAFNEKGSTWVWGGNHWLPRPSGDLPAGAFGAGMTFDSATRTLLLVSATPPNSAGTSTWRWDATGWREIRANIAAAACGVALDPATGHLLLCGTKPGAPAAQLWSWSGVAWAPLLDSQLPIQPEAETTDLNHGVLVILGSLTQTSQGSPQPLELWAWSGAVWQRLDAGAG